MSKTLFGQIDQLVDTIISEATDASILSSTAPAKEMLKLFLSLKQPFEERIIGKFSTGHSDAVAKGIKRLFSQAAALPYFQSMISLSYFYWNWMQQYDLGWSEQIYDDLTLSLIYGAIGYKLLDTYFDRTTAQKLDAQIATGIASQLYLAKYLISYQESTLARYFDNHELFAELMEKYDRLYCNFGIAELKNKFKKCPISKSRSVQLGYKSAPLMVYFALVLDKTGLRSRLDDYEQMFFLTTASIQIQDDIYDAPEDLAEGNITLASADFIRQIDYEKLLRKPGTLTKKFREYLSASKTDLKLFKLANSNLEKALAISQKYQDNVFELFVLSKNLGILEKINRKEAEYARRERKKSKSDHQGKDRTGQKEHRAKKTRS